MKRGEVWWAELAGDAGFRPVAIVSRDARQARQAITIAEVSRRIRSVPSEVLLDESDGMATRCVINCTALHTIPVDRLRSRVTRLGEAQVFALDRALRFALGLDE
ncbi:MAG: type II toxin-antitoxin system PemK/MazF family toxin [Phycisphaerales bacterium]|nr:type II toxin-antitoxin system PemK/MazF family toxin [Phycisphaerales bacterium]